MLTITSVQALDDDVLHVLALDDADGNEYEALGWVSATTNYYPPEDYAEMYVDANGQWQLVDANTPAGAARDVRHVAGAKPRAMTADEVGKYAVGLVLEQNPDLAARVAAPTPAPTPVAFTAAPVSLTPPSPSTGVT